jgi:glycyl-tRNA synthetase
VSGAVPHAVQAPDVDLAWVGALSPALPARAARSYNDAVTYGELFLQNEYEMSCYNLDEADVGEQVPAALLTERWPPRHTPLIPQPAFPAGCPRLPAACSGARRPTRASPPSPRPPQRQRFALFDAEARRLLAKRLPVPAYDHLLKLSHTFNILDARGAVGVTERADCFATMRALAREVTGGNSRADGRRDIPEGRVPNP